MVDGLKMGEAWFSHSQRDPHKTWHSLGGACLPSPGVMGFSEQSNGFVPLRAPVLCGGDGIQRGIGCVEACHLQVCKGVVAGTGGRGQAGGHQIAVGERQGRVAEGTQRFQVEAIVLLLPEVPFQTKEIVIGSLLRGDLSGTDKGVFCFQIPSFPRPLFNFPEKR